MCGFMTPGQMARMQAFQPMQFQQSRERAIGSLSPLGVDVRHNPRIHGTGMVGDALPHPKPRWQEKQKERELLDRRIGEDSKPEYLKVDEAFTSGPLRDKIEFEQKLFEAKYNPTDLLETPEPTGIFKNLPHLGKGF